MNEFGVVVVLIVATWFLCLILVNRQGDCHYLKPVPAHTGTLVCSRTP